MLSVTDAGEFPNPETAHFTSQHDPRRIGDGRESVVIDIGQYPPKVVAFSRFGLSPEQAKATFYLQNIFVSLFPHNFPHFYAVFGNPDGNQGLTGSIRKKIEPHEQSPLLLKQLLKLPTPHQINYPFYRVLNISEKYRLPVSFDLAYCNFITGRDGGEYYVDTIGLTCSGWNINNLWSFLDSDELSVNTVQERKRVKQIVAHSLQRLNCLDIVDLL